ncbi:hypothetical protein NJ7G_0212 [Natrinema sp. J7-2]|nr:hypothetical protein NJ7G_0212 [Natrinema sp. J7-2]
MSQSVTDTQAVSSEMVAEEALEAGFEPRSVRSLRSVHSPRRIPYFVGAAHG